MPVYKSAAGWKIVNVSGSHKTKKEAEKQLRAIEAAKEKKKKK